MVAQHQRARKHTHTHKMDSIFTDYVAKDPETAADLMEVLTNSTVEELSMCMSEDDVVMYANPFFTKVGGAGRLEDQRKQARKIIKDNEIPCIELNVMQALGQTVVGGYRVINPMTTADRGRRGMCVFMKPLDVLLMLASARTPKSRALRRGLLAFFCLARSEVEKAMKKDWMTIVSVTPKSFPLNHLHYLFKAA